MACSAASAAIFTLALVIIGWRGVEAAKQTLRAIERQVHVMQRELVISHRAYLSVGNLENPIGNKAIFPIENHGHVPAFIESVDVEIISDVGTEVGNWNRAKAILQSVVPGGIPFELSISLPTDTIDSGQVVVSATITYYMGFEESTQKEPAQTQIFNFVRVYLREKSQWVVASHYAEIDFTERAQDAQNEQS